jgi:hypothetical protein
MAGTSPAMTNYFRETMMLATTIRQNVKPGSMRRLKRALTIGSALVLLLVAGLFALNAFERVQIARFYEAHPMLGMMNKFPSTVDPGMVDILLKRVPIGSMRSDAIQILAGEGMECGSVDSSSRKLLVCGAKDREPRHLIPRWHVEIQFDQSDKVSGGRVLALKAG